MNKFYWFNKITNFCQSKFSTSQVRSHAKLNFIQIQSKDKESIGDSYNLIVCHGLMGSSNNFRSLVSNQNISSEASSYLIDLRNHGKSQHTDAMSNQLMAADIIEFMQIHQIEQNVILMGHSLGGRVMMSLVGNFHQQVQNLVQGVIILDILPINYLSSGKNKGISETYQMIKNLRLIQMEQNYNNIKTQVLSACGGNPLIANFIMTNVEGISDDVYRWQANLKAIVDNYKYMIGDDITGNWTGPHSVFVGEKSPYINSESIKTLQNVFPKFDPNENLVIFPNANHWIHFENPALFISQVTKFIKTVQNQSL